MATAFLESKFGYMALGPCAIALWVWALVSIPIIGAIIDKDIEIKNIPSEMHEAVFYSKIMRLPTLPLLPLIYSKGAVPFPTGAMLFFAILTIISLMILCVTIPLSISFRSINILIICLIWLFFFLPPKILHKISIITGAGGWIDVGKYLILVVTTIVLFFSA